MHTGSGEGFNFGIGGIIGTSDNGTGMAHASARGGGLACDERRDGLFYVLFDVGGGFDLVGATNLANHEDRVSVWVCLEEGDGIDVVGAADGISADPDAGALGEAALTGLPDCFIGEGA